MEENQVKMHKNAKPTISTLSIATLIFVVPTITIFVLKFVAEIDIPMWIPIVTSVVAIILGIIDLDLDKIIKRKQLHFFSVLAIVISTIAISLSVTFLSTAYYVDQATSGISDWINEVNDSVDSYNSLFND